MTYKRIHCIQLLERPEDAGFVFPASRLLVVSHDSYLITEVGIPSMGIAIEKARKLSGNTKYFAPYRAAVQEFMAGWHFFPRRYDWWNACTLP